MTEIERIKREGWLPTSFWREEVKCDFLVTEERKQVWAIILDLFREFVRVCEKYNLRYFAVAGTCLGVVRHQGFIPWDDDMDVVMPREDYEKFKTLAGEFRHPYFLQTPDTDSEYGYSFLKLRNSNTASIVEKFIHCNFNQGIFFDIFPLDRVSDEDFAPRRSRIFELIMENSAHMKFGGAMLTDRDREVIETYYDANKTTADVFHELEAVAGAAEKRTDSKYLTILVCTVYPIEKRSWPAEIFDDYRVMEFEGLPIRVPVGWEQLMTINFGDYRKFPPVEQRGKWHSCEFHVDKSYLEVLPFLRNKNNCIENNC